MIDKQQLLQFILDLKSHEDDLVKYRKALTKVVNKMPDDAVISLAETGGDRPKPPPNP